MYLHGKVMLVRDQSCPARSNSPVLQGSPRFYSSSVLYVFMSIKMPIIKLSVIQTFYFSLEEDLHNLNTKQAASRTLLVLPLNMTDVDERMLKCCCHRSYTSRCDSEVVYVQKAENQLLWNLHMNPRQIVAPPKAISISNELISSATNPGVTLGRCLASLALSFLIRKLEVGGGVCKAFPQTLRGGCPNPIPVCLLCARKTMVSKGQTVPGLVEWAVLWRRPALVMWLPTQVKTHICGRDQEGGEPRAPQCL